MDLIGINQDRPLEIIVAEMMRFSLPYSDISESDNSLVVLYFNWYVEANKLTQKSDRINTFHHRTVRFC